MLLPRTVRLGLLALVGFGLAGSARPAAVDPALFQDLRWRLIGPFRGGRVLAVAGVPGEREPLLLRQRQRRRLGDARRRAHLEADLRRPADRLDRRARRRALEPAGPLRRHGRGRHALGHRAGRRHVQVDRRRQDLDAHRPRATSQQIGRILVDPRDPDLVYVAALGHPYGPNPERGVFRSRDGGRTWQKVLGKDDDTGAIDLAFEPGNPRGDLRRALADAAPALEHLPALERPGQRRSTSRPTAATPGRAIAGTGLPGTRSAAIGLAVAPTPPAARLRDGRRRRERRPLSLRRRRRDLDARERRSAHLGARLVLRRRHGRPEGRRTSSTRCNTTLLPLATTAARRSCPIKGDPGRRRLPRAVDRPGRPGAPDPRRRPGRGRHAERRRDLELLVQPADRPVLPRDRPTTASPTGSTARSRTPAPPACRAAPTHRDGINTDALPRDRPPAARTTTSPPTRRDPDIVYGGRVDRLDLRTRPDAHGRSDARAIPSIYRATWTLPLVFSRRDPRVLYFANQRLFRTERRRRALDASSAPT